MPDLKNELHNKLNIARAVVLSKLDGLSEYDMRRPMTPTGTNVLVRMVTETSQHAGHADIVRELIDVQAGNDANFADDVDWPEYVGCVQAAADSFC